MKKYRNSFLNKFTERDQRKNMNLEALREVLTLPNALYIDPSAVTVAASSIGGIVIAVGAAVAIWWRRAKRKAAQALHIDENAHKEVEEDLVINEEEKPTETAEEQTETKESDAQ